MLQARPLNTSSSARVESEIVAVVLKSEPKASWPEKRTASGDFPAASAKAIASPPTASPATIVSTKVLVSTRRFDQRASSMIAKQTTATTTASTIVQAKSPHPGPPKGGRGKGL